MVIFHMYPTEEPPDLQHHCPH